MNTGKSSNKKDSSPFKNLLNGSLQNPRRQKPEDGKKKPPRKEPPRTALAWLFLIALVIVGLPLATRFDNLRETKITYSQFQRILNDSDVRVLEARVELQGINRGVLHGTIDNPDYLARLSGDKKKSENFYVNLPFIDSEMLAQWDERGFHYTFESEDMNWFYQILGYLPWLLIIGVFWFFMIRQMQAGQRGIFSFGKSRAKLQNMDRPKSTFSDAAGVEEAKAELQEVIEFLKDPAKFNKLGGKIPKGVLLLGPPGTGKTLLARCVAGEAKVPFLSMSGSDFVEMFVGVGASRVRDLFETAKKNAPCIVFVDEIDAVGRQRGAGLGGGHDEREQTLNQMLVEMDGFEENSGVILIAATNRPDVLDPALLRPGRFDRQVVVDVPDIKGRLGILQVHSKHIPLGDDVNLETIARGTPGFVGADLRNLVNEAALMAARFNQTKVGMLDFEEAKDKVLMGTERKSMVMSEKQKRLIAYHEAGHAICTLNCSEADPLHKVTIIPRGRALGVTASLPEEDRLNHSKQHLLDRLCVLLGGRVAEEIIFETQSNGAYNDIKVATEIVRRMVCDFGMTDELGPISYGQKNEQIFLGREISRHRDYSERTAQQIDTLMRSFIEQQLNRARTILLENREKLDLLAKALLEHELLDREEIHRVLRGEVLESARKTRSLPGPVTSELDAVTSSASDGKGNEKRAVEDDKQQSRAADSGNDDTPG